jgi:DNA replication ATP-dependent helicase Dna2
MFPSQKAQEFYSEWFHLLSKEAWFLETRLATAFDPSTLNDRVERGETFRVVQVEPWSRHGTDDAGEPAGQPPWTNSDHSFVQLSFGDSPADLVYGQEVILHEGDPAAPTSWRGRIYHVDYDGAVVLRVQRAGMDGSGREEDFPDTMYLDQLPFLRAIEVARRSLLDFFLHGDQEVIRIVAGGADGETMDASNGSVPNRSNTAACVGYEGDLLYSDGLAGELNEAQEQALNSALQGSPYHLIHGPPGTGKTRVVSRLISRCLDRGDRVLLVCPTNVALDRVMAAVLELGASNMLRVGGSHSVTPALAYLLDRVSGPGILLDDLLAGDYRLPDFVKMVNATPLIGATAYQVASHHLFLAQKFDLVVVDEAGQLDEPSTLAALALAPRFVLCGDPFQLSPVVQHACGASLSGLALQRSLMERLMAGAESHRISRLTVQYRMNREIQDIPGRLFYRGLLHPSPEVAGRRLSIPARISKNGWIDRILDPDRPAVFVNVEGPECGAARREEADVVVTLVQALLKCGIPPEEIGVITPYRAQQSLIRKELGSRTNVRSAVSVDTVDRFQGGEREVILLSLARSDGVTSFLADPKRLNVSLSRARSKLVLLGRGSVLEGHSLFRDLLAGLDRVDVSRESCNDLPA